MASHRTITIVGAGIAGLTLGRALRSRGVPVVLYDRSKAPSRHPYSIILRPWAFEPLLEILGTDIITFRSQVAVRRAQDVPYESSPFRVNRARFEALLQEGLQIERGDTLFSAQRNERGVLLSFEGRPAVQASCVVAADGPMSQMRGSLVPGCQLTVHGFIVFNGKRWFSSEDYKRVTTHYDGTTDLQTKLGDVLLQTYVNDYGKGQISISYTYSRPARPDLDPLHKPERPLAGATDIPEEFYQELNGLEALDEPFKTIFNPEEIRKVRTLHWLMRSALVPESDVLALAKEDIHMLGEALHATPIIGSNGANVAISDGLELGECLASRSDAQSFYRERYGKWGEMVRKSDQRLREMHKTMRPSL